MRALVLWFATAGLLAFASPAMANASVDTQATPQATDFSSRETIVIRDGRRHHRHRGWHRHHRDHGCRTIVTKRWHHGRRIVKRTRVCR